jgi:TFIIH basal transcription factor complex TTD-A subunit
MPRATAGKPLSSLARDVYKLTSLQGTLVQCDPSIKAIISKINEENGGLYISEDIDDETCLINTKKLDELKQKLKDVWHPSIITPHQNPLTLHQALKDTVREAEDSSSE